MGGYINKATGVKPFNATCGAKKNKNKKKTVVELVLLKQWRVTSFLNLASSLQRFQIRRESNLPKGCRQAPSCSNQKSQWGCRIVCYYAKDNSRNNKHTHHFRIIIMIYMFSQGPDVRKKHFTCPARLMYIRLKYTP